MTIGLTACGGGDPPDTAVGAQPASAPAGTAWVPGRDLTEAEARPDLSQRPRSAGPAEVAGASRIALPALPADMRKQLALQAQPGQPRQIGLARSLASPRSGVGTVATLPWQPNRHGGVSAAVELRSAGAVGLRAGLRIERLPDLAVLRVYAPDGPTEHVASGLEINRLLAANRAAGDSGLEADTWWTPYVEGDALVLAIDLPPGVRPDELALTLPRLTHFVESPRAVAQALAAAEQVRLSPGDSSSCNLNATCYPQYDNERRSVAHYSYQSGGKGYICTGTLLNDSTGSGTPYFLTANHCISTQSEASSIITHWFADHASCSASLTRSPSYTTRSGGATLLQAQQLTDVALLRLNQSPPSGARFAGWSAGLVGVGTPVVGIHHPSGDLKKISFGSVQGYASCSTGGSGGFSCSSASASSGRFLSVRWSQGITEGGSSGSAIWADVGGQMLVVGTLYGGGSSCSNAGGPDRYGRFDLAYLGGLNQFLGAGSGGMAPPVTGGATPQSGWWWNASESGRGFAIERRGNTLFVAGFMYADGGRDVWYAGGATRGSSGAYMGELREYQGGADRVAGSPYRGPSSNWVVASMELSFQSETQGTLRLRSGSAVRDIAITRFSVSGFSWGYPVSSFESGWWWNPAENGHGYFIEESRGRVFAAAYTYYDYGSAGWYTMEGTLANILGSGSERASGNVSWFRNGQTLWGDYRAPEGPFTPYTFEFTATSATTGILRFSSGAQINLQRFVF